MTPPSDPGHPSECCDDKQGSVTSLRALCNRKLNHSLHLTWLGKKTLFLEQAREGAAS